MSSKLNPRHSILLAPIRTARLMNDVPAEIFAMICRELAPMYMVRLRRVCRQILTKLATLGLTDATSCPTTTTRMSIAFTIEYRYWPIHDRSLISRLMVYSFKYIASYEKIGRCMVLILRHVGESTLTRYLYINEGMAKYMVTVIRPKLHISVLSSATYIPTREYLKSWLDFTIITTNLIRPTVEYDTTAQMAILGQMSRYPHLNADQVILLGETIDTLASL